MKIYCVKCKEKTDTDNIENIITQNNRAAVRGNCKICNKIKYMFVKNDSGTGIDIHKMIGKLPRPKTGFVVPTYHYLGPYNALHKQVKFDPSSGVIEKVIQEPSNALDRIAMKHDICYTTNPQNKGDCDRQMVKSIDEMPYKDMNEMAMLTRTIINKKQQLGLGVKKKRHDNR